jgi:stage II sporulation protein D
LKRILILMGFWTLILLLLPFLLVKGWNSSYAKWSLGFEKEGVVDAIYINQNETKGKTIKMLFEAKNEVAEITVYDYLCGVVAAELPIGSPEEAIKAQAVAAFTYMAYRMEAELSKPGIILEHKGAYICDDSTHCLAYISKESAKIKWGQKLFDENWGKIEKEVSSVLGKVITYSNEPINAVFSAMSAGTTESAKDVWGKDVPYLTGVNSEWDGKAADFHSEVKVSEENFKSIITGLDSSIKFEGEPNKWLGEEQKTTSGGIKSIQICGKAFLGTAIRKTFSLKSTNFSLTFGDGNFTFKVKGNGHGVGLSQTGAIYLANAGKSYEEILKYYYKDVHIEDFIWKN